MKCVILLAVIGYSLAAPAQVEDATAEILRSESEVRENSYKYGYETSNGIKAEAEGDLKQIGDTSAVVARGSYNYNALDGTPVLVTYTADETGYHPQSDLLPVGPETPNYVKRALEWTAAQLAKA